MYRWAMKIDQVRSFALSLPGTSEQPHFEKSSFRVNNKIFVTVLPDNAHIHVMLDRREVERAVAEGGTALEELWWGKRLTGVRIDLAEAQSARVIELVTSAWRRKAPKRLVAEFDQIRP
jgi:hypothetical protein